MQRKKTFFVDYDIDLFAQADACDWHLASLVERLSALGCDVTDARDFAAFAFAAVAHDARPAATPSAWTCLTNRQRARLYERWT